MWIIGYRKYFYSLSGALLALTVVALLVWGLKFGIDFTGGSLMEVTFSATSPVAEEVVAVLENSGITGSSVRPTGESGFLIRTPFLSASEHENAVVSLTTLGAFEESRFDSVGPTIGTELKTKAVWAILLVLVAIAVFIMVAFRKVSKSAVPETAHRVPSFYYGLIALLALAHDVLIPVGAFALFGVFFSAEVDTLFVTALLVILGFSVHDTIVVFDRVRENLRLNQEKNGTEPFDETVGRSVMQTLARSINTSLTTVLALVALYVFGPETIRFFVLALIIGIVAGTYSSIFLASPLLVTLERFRTSKAGTKS